MLKPVQAVLFDLDGTLVHSPIDFTGMRRGLLDLARAAGIDPTPWQDLDLLALAATVAERTPDPAHFRREAEEQLIQIELAACAASHEAVGALDILAWLRRSGVGIGIVTRNSRRAVSVILQRHSLPHDVLLTREDTPRVKPDPLHLHLALQRLRVPASDAVMVGDHPMDIQGGRAAGAFTLGILLPGRPPDYFAEARPDGILRSLQELPQWISPSSS